MFTHIEVNNLYFYGSVILMGKHINQKIQKKHYIKVRKQESLSVKQYLITYNSAKVLGLTEWLCSHVGQITIN